MPTEVGLLVARLLRIIQDQTGLSDLGFNIGCTRTELQQLETTLKASLPNAYLQLLENNNGQSSHVIPFPPDQLTFLDSAAVIKHWNELNQYQENEFFDEFQCDDKVRCVLYHPGRIPIAHNETSGAYLSIDLIPGPEGTPGQLVFNINEIDCVVVEENVTALLSSYVATLERGTMKLEKNPPKYGTGYWFTVDGNI